MLSNKERKQKQDYLRRKANNFLSKGVTKMEIKNAFEGRTVFTGLSDDELDKVYYAVKRKKLKQTSQNALLPSDHIEKVKLYHGENFKEEMLTSRYKNIKKSNFYGKTKKDILNEKRLRDKQVKDNYINQLKKLEQSLKNSGTLNKQKQKQIRQVMKQVRKISYKDFSTWLSQPYSFNIDFNAIFIQDSDQDLSFFNPQSISKVFDNILHYSSQFHTENNRRIVRKSKRRGKK